MGWDEKHRYSELCRKRGVLDNSALKPAPGEREQYRLGRSLARASYPGWQFSVKDDRGSFSLIAFRPHPFTGALQRLGPWPLPEDAGEEEVRDAALAAVVEADGPWAADRFAWLAPK